MAGYGIDYGLGRTNVDLETGIRFGVIPMHALSEWAHEDFENDYGEPMCPKCGNAVVDYDDEDHEEYAETKHGCDDYACEACERTYDSGECYGDEPCGSYLDDGEYKAEYHNDGDVFILKSPYYTHAQFCSPCAPGACYLTSPTDKHGPKAYCFSHDWFESKKAPYPVFRVDNGQLVKPEPK